MGVVSIKISEPIVLSAKLLNMGSTKGQLSLAFRLFSIGVVDLLNESTTMDKIFSGVYIIVMSSNVMYHQQIAFGLSKNINSW